MKKLKFVEQVDKDMDFEAECVVEDLREYAKSHDIVFDYICEAFAKAFMRRSSRKKEGE